MNQGSDELHVRESYTYTREVSGSNPGRLLELLQDARRELDKGLSTERLTVILDRALHEAAGTGPALAQPLGTMLGSTAAVEVATGEQVPVNAANQAA